MTILLNPIVVITLLLALACYSVLIDGIYVKNKDEHWCQRCVHWLPVLQNTLAAIPLLGLLGTIIGLLNVFSLMATGDADLSQLFSKGIADAMLTTKVALLAVIPGWVLLAYLKNQLSNATAQQLQLNHET